MRPELANSVLLRQNPQNVEQWHRRVKLFEGNPSRQILTYTEAVWTIDPMKAEGKPHTLWVAFATLYEKHNDVANARVIFDKAVQVNYKIVDHLAAVWCEWAEMELRHKNFQHALQLMRRATAEPSVEVKRRVAAAGGKKPVQMRLHKSFRLWTFYVDLEESLGTLESTKAVYERILDLKIARPQIIVNYAMLLEDHKFFEEAFKVYERGVNIFKYPRVKDIWITYLFKFVKTYGKSKLERARELFERAVEAAPADAVKPLFLQYAKLEEDYGLVERAMCVYDLATKAVPTNEKLSMYEIYIARAAEISRLPKTREIYEQTINLGLLPDEDVKTMCLKYAELEKSLGEIGRAHVLYKYASNYAHPQSDPGFWDKWNEFEMQYGNDEGTFSEMLRVKISVYKTHNIILPELLRQKDQIKMQKLEEEDVLIKHAGVDDDQMAAIERQLEPNVNETSTEDRHSVVEFPNAGVVQSGAHNGTANKEEEDMEILEGSGSNF